MKTKWYLSTLVVVFTFLGIFLNQASSPNQEILVQFSSEEITTQQSDKAIAVIKRQLQDFGIDSFHIQKSENGDLRISYHSSMDVESIKKALSQNELHLDFESSNQHDNGSRKSSEKNQNYYNLDVYDLHKTSDGNNSAGKYVIVVKQDYDRFLNSNFYPSFNQTDFNLSTEGEKVANNSCKAVVFATNQNAHIIPEVRAGPTSFNS